MQAYTSDLVTSVTWASKELKAFRQVHVPPGECSLVTTDGRRVVEPGEVELLVGPSSRDADLLRAGFTIRA